jgi:hypothetical protein
MGEQLGKFEENMVIFRYKTEKLAVLIRGTQHIKEMYNIQAYLLIRLPGCTLHTDIVLGFL